MKKSIPIELDKVRNLRYGTNALCQMEDMLGKPISGFEETETGIKDLRIMLYCGLKWQDRRLSLVEVGNLMDEAISEKGIDYLNDKLVEALELALGTEKKTEQEY